MIEVRDSFEQNDKKKSPVKDLFSLPISNIHPSAFRTPSLLPVPQNGTSLIFKRSAPLVLFFPGFQESKHRIVSDPEIGVVLAILLIRTFLHFPDSSNSLVTAS